MFKTGIVLHYVSEYSKNQFDKNYSFLSEYQKNKSLRLEIDNDIALKNISENLPIGTIICRAFDDVDAIEVCLPMFSSHISMPVKINEVVWYFTDNTPFTSDVLEDFHPLFSLKNYWLSRKIGGKISEDLNYTHFQRDSLITNIQTLDKEKYVAGSSGSANKKQEKNYNKEIEKVVKIPDFENGNHYIDFFETGILENSSEVLKREKNISFYPDAVPRWFSKPYELTLQGSNNTLINLTKTNNVDEEFINKGAIDIVAGRFFLDKYIEENDDNFHIFENKIIKNKSKDREKTFKLKKNSFPVIENTLGNLETLKSQKYYLNTEEINESIEGFANINKDASRLYISECDNIDNFSYYDTFWITDHDTLLFDKESGFENNEDFIVEKGYLNDEVITRKNLASFPLDENNFSLPSILLKSNNIRVVSRKRHENEKDEKSLEEGSIRLIKESDSFSSYSHLCLENDGQVLVDGRSILLGNFKKEVVRQEILPEDEALTNLPEDNETFIPMHGNGNGLLIGYDENLAEPLVLGNSLESMLKELIHVNLYLLDELTKVSNNVLKHTHSGVTPGGAITQPANAPPTLAVVFDTDKFVGSESGNIETRYKNLRDNLVHMLSRFAKTT